MSSRLFDHITIADVKRKQRENIVMQKIREENKERREEELRVEFEETRSDWRSELEEQMTTGNAFAYAADAEPGINLVTIDTGVAAEFGPNQEIYADDVFDPAGSVTDGLADTAIAASGSGSGDSGGFDTDSTYLQFTGGSPVGSDDGGSIRAAFLDPIDCTNLDTIILTGIRGDDSNGGRDPQRGEWSHLGSADLEIWYSIPGFTNTITPLWAEGDSDDFAPGMGLDDGIIIPADSSDTILRDWTLHIPHYARSENTQFIIWQGFNYGTENETGFLNYGVTKVRYQRRSPLNVFASLDSPEAVSFIRDTYLGQKGVGSRESREKKRKRLIAQLRASRQYTDKAFGTNFPGSRFVLPGQVTGAPLGRTAMLTQWGSKSGAPPRVTLGRRWSAVERATSAATTLQRYGTTTAGRNRMRRGALNPFGQRERVRSGAAGRKRVKVYSGRSYRGKRGYGKTTYGTTDKRTAGTYTRRGWSKGIRGTGMSRGGTIDRGTLPQRYIDKYGSRSVTGQQQIKLGRKAAQRTFGPGKKTYVKRTPQSQANFRSRVNAAIGQDTRANVAGKPKQLTPRGTLKTRYPSSSRNWGKIAKNVGYGLGRGVLQGVGGKYVKAATKAYDAYQTGKSLYKWSKSSQAKKTRSRISQGFKSIGKTFKSWTNRSKKSTKGPNRYQRRSRYYKFYNDFEWHGNALMEGRLKRPKAFFNQADIKPTYPEDPPPETINGWHPDLIDGEKVSQRYNKLDPMSAKAMPKTGNPHIDRKVAKAAKKPKIVKPKVMKHLNVKDLKKKQQENIEFERMRVQEKEEVNRILMEHHQEMEGQISNWRTDLTNA